MVPTPDNGIQHLSSPYSVPETLKRIESTLQEKGLTIFCRIDHSGEAEKVGLKMRPTLLILFGSPKGGTPVMVASPTIAIDLPLKALISEDAGGKVAQRSCRSGKKHQRCRAAPSIGSKVG
jgi:uncharacterized protein (DUF302 family)